LFKCKDFDGFTAKTLHFSSAHCDAPTKIRIVYMPELHKKQLKKCRFYAILRRYRTNKSQ